MHSSGAAPPPKAATTSSRRVRLRKPPPPPAGIISFLPGEREPQSRLHGFYFPPFLKWGRQRVLRCSRRQPAESGGRESSSPPPESSQKRKWVKEKEGDDEVSEVRARLMSLYDAAVENIEKAAIRRFKKESSPTLFCSPLPSAPTPMAVAATEASAITQTATQVAAAAAAAPAAVLATGEGEAEAAAGKAKPWNLRMRKSGCNAPKPQEEKWKFSLTLSKEEIEEDMTAMFGSKPHRRVKRRSQKLQKMIDKVFPGSRLIDVTADMYDTT